MAYIERIFSNPRLDEELQLEAHKAALALSCGDIDEFERRRTMWGGNKTLFNTTSLEYLLTILRVSQDPVVEVVEDVVDATNV